MRKVIIVFPFLQARFHNMRRRHGHTLVLQLIIVFSIVATLSSNKKVTQCVIIDK